MKGIFPIKNFVSAALFTLVDAIYTHSQAKNISKGGLSNSRPSALGLFEEISPVPPIFTNISEIFLDPHLTQQEKYQYFKEFWSFVLKNNYFSFEIPISF